MANLILKNDVQPITSVFQPITLKYEWEEPNCLVYNTSGFLGVRVDLSFNSDVAVGDFIQVLNGSYKGTYEVTSKSTDATYVYFVTNGTWNGTDLTSNLFNVDAKQIFALYAGYQSGAGQTAKPYQKIADIAVSINPITALFEVDVQAYLRSYYSISAPVAGVDYGLSLQWDLQTVSGTDVVPTASDIAWSLNPTFPIAAGLRIVVDGTEEVNQLLAGTSGTINAESGQSVFVDTIGVEDFPNTGTVTLTILNTTDATTVYTETKDKTNNNGRITYTFTTERDKDYSVTVTTAA